jgi:hypothetical protein
MQHMNPSRDIEKLFDQFGGDASGYQEIGRENEASHARTRWPLLATLDLSQPSIPTISTIPNISQNRDSLLSPVQNRSAEARKKPWGASSGTGVTGEDSAPITPANAAAAAPAFTRDTRPRLFSRPNRKTIPPVANIALPGSPVGAERFSALVDAVEGVSNVEETPVVAAPVAPELIARLQPQTQAAQPQPQPQLQPQLQANRPTLPRSQPLSTPEKLPGFASAFQMQRPQPAAKPSLPRIQPTPAAPEPKSILGKLFRPQSNSHTERAPRPDSLQSMFERLREPAAAVSSDEAPVAGSWLAKRASQS